MIDIVAMTSNIPDPNCSAAISAINTAYGHPDIPVGAIRGDAMTDDEPVTAALIDALPHAIRGSQDTEDPVTLISRLLEDRPDRSVTIVGLGAYTNLAGLVEHAGDLVAAKVRCLVMMDGLFPDGGPALTNQLLDPRAAERVIGDPGWPTPIAWVDGYTGIETLVGASLRHAVDESNPMRIAYEALFGTGPPRDGNWDAPAVLYAAHGCGTWFVEAGRGGAAFVTDEGGLAWRRHAPNRPDDVYVHVADRVAQRALNAAIEALLIGH